MVGFGSVGDGRRRVLGSGLSCVVEGEPVPDRVEVDQGGGPCGLQSRFGAAEVAALASTVAVSEQSEQPLDPWSAAPEMLCCGWVSEGLAGGEQQFVVVAELDLAASASRAALSLQRTPAADLRREARLAKAVRGNRDRDGVAGRGR